MSRKPLVPEAKEKLGKLKTEYANEIDLKLNDTYKWNETSKSNRYLGGHIGGLMTKTMIEEYKKNLIDK